MQPHLFSLALAVLAASCTYLFIPKRKKTLIPYFNNLLSKKKKKKKKKPAPDLFQQPSKPALSLSVDSAVLSVNPSAAWAPLAHASTATPSPAAQTRPFVKGPPPPQATLTPAAPSATATPSSAAQTLPSVTRTENEARSQSRGSAPTFVWMTAVVDARRWDFLDLERTYYFVILGAPISCANAFSMSTPTHGAR